MVPHGLALPILSLGSAAFLFSFGQHRCSFLFFGVEHLETQISVINECAVWLHYF
jgi:hypothetical protein